MQYNRTYLIGGIAVLAALIIGIAGYFAWNAWGPVKIVPAMGQPVDIVLDFYQPWLETRTSTTTTSFKEYGRSAILGDEARAYLREAQKQVEGVDPVLCMSQIPSKIAARPIFETADEAQVLVTGRDPETGEQAVVTLRPLEGGWYIHQIACSPGEFAPEREFSFEHEGFLLKNVPAPLNSQYWHIVFEENGQPGHFAPLFFSAESSCKALDGSTATCSPDTLRETTKVKVQGQMTELGVQVKNLEILKGN